MCICMSTYAHACGHMHILTHARVCMPACTCMHTACVTTCAPESGGACLQASLHLCLHTCLHAHLRACVHVRTYADSCACTCACACAYKYAYIYITIDDEIQLCLGTHSFMLAIPQTIISL